MKVAIPTINMERLTQDVNRIILEANLAAAKAFVKTASQVPGNPPDSNVSGQLRGSFAPLAETAGGRLGPTIPSSPKSNRHKDQSYARGRGLQDHTISNRKFEYTNAVPYLFNRGPKPEQYHWNDAWRQGGLKAVSAWYASIEKSDLPDKIFDKIRIV